MTAVAVPSPLVPISPIIAQIPIASSLSVPGIGHILAPTDSILLIWEVYVESAFGPMTFRITDTPAAFGGTIVDCTNMMRLDERDPTPILATIKSSNLPSAPDQVAWSDGQEAYFAGAGSASGPFQPWRARDALAYPLIVEFGGALEFQLPGVAGVTGRVILVWDEIQGAGGPT